jgi:7-cyano-7-deazaguanine synthase
MDTFLNYWSINSNMCAIFGVLGNESKINQARVDALALQASARGRDGTRYQKFGLSRGKVAYLGNARAAPTTELSSGPLQPYEGLVHNGTISNDVELGRKDGEIDSMVLPRVLDTLTFQRFVESLKKIEGSYALATISDHSVFLARNYKPLYYIDYEGATWFASMPYMLENALNLSISGVAPVEVPPYSAVDLRSFLTIPVDRRIRNENKVLVIASAGLDSTAVATYYAAQGKEVTLLHFKYGCVAQTREIACIERIAEALNQKFATSCKVRILSLPYEQINSTSPILAEGRDIAGGVEGAEFAFEWVPARNLLMVAAGVALAEAEDYGTVSLGLNIEESGAYPDNEEAFTHGLNNIMAYAVATKKRVQIECPFDRFTKREIVKIGLDLGAPFEHTWSCYRGGETHCGQCAPCFMRATAFERNGIKDPVMK